MLAAKPFVAKGDYERVEKYMKDLRSEGSPLDDFCVTSLLHAYGNAKPKQTFRAQAALKHFLSTGARLSDNARRALKFVGLREDGQMWSASSKQSTNGNAKRENSSPESQGCGKCMSTPPGLTKKSDLLSASCTPSAINFEAYDQE
jgi:hypothetical protein